MLFKSDPKKPAYEVIFPRKKKEETHPVSFRIILKFPVQILKSTWVYFLVTILLLQRILRINLKKRIWCWQDKKT